MKKFMVFLVTALFGIAVFGAGNMVQSSGNLLWLNPGADVEAGDMIDIGERYAVALVDIASNATGSVKTDGVWQFGRGTTNAITVGQALYYSSAQIITTTAAANKYVGQAIEAAAVHTNEAVAEAGTLKINLDLNATAEQDRKTYITGAALGATALQPDDTADGTYTITDGSTWTNTITVSDGLITEWVVEE
jgi:predicted RecA/RadA family phage recombinase